MNIPFMNRFSGTMHTLFSLFILVGVIFTQAFPQGNASAAANLTIAPITWNVIGLDSNNVNVGPNQFPVGVRVCNTGDAAATNVLVDFYWDDGLNAYTGDTYINLRGDSLDQIQFSSMSAGACKDAYFEVAVTRRSDAYTKTREYHITVDSNETGQVSTRTPRELYVEYLISQNRNATLNVSYGVTESALTSVAAGGSMNLQVGGEYYIKLDAKTATQGYNQLESFINFPNTLFQILEVKTIYSANTSPYVANTNDLLYADACLWDMDPNSETYHSCIGSDDKSGGSVVTTYKVKILSGAGTTQSLNTLIYDFSGSSFHYNSDFESGIRFAVIGSPLTVSKSFSPNVILNSGDPSTLTLTIENTSAVQVNSVNLVDPLPVGLKVAASPSVTTSAGCISPSFSPAANDTTLTFNGSVAASGICTLTVAVVATADGSYLNTTNSLLINGGNTGLTASDNLTVSTAGLSCISTPTIAHWTFPTTTLPPAPIAGALVTTSAAFSTANNTISTTAGDNYQTAGTYAWAAQGWPKTATITSASTPYYEFRIDNGAAYTNLNISFAYKTDTNWGGTTTDTPTVYVFSSPTGAAGSYSLIYTSPAMDSTYQTSGTISAASTGAASTYFRIIAKGALNNQGYMYLDNVIVGGCEVGTLDKPQLSKSFATSPIKVGEASKLIFTLTNPNSANSLTSVSFTDALPAGMSVSTAAGLPTSTCAGATFAPAEGDTTITFSGGTIPAGSPGTCTAEVYVTTNAVGSYINTTGFISSTQTGINTNAYNVSEPGQGQATLTVNAAPPTVTKSFSPNPISSGGTSTLTFIISNPNSTSALTGVNFTDDFSSQSLSITTVGTVSTTCLGADVSASTSTKVVMTGATLTGGQTCMVSVDVTSATVNTSGYENSVTVGSSAGNSTPSTDKLIVNAPAPKLVLLKEIATSPTGPWATDLVVEENTNLYYRFTIENTGDVSFSPVWVEDPDLPQAAACSWPAVLPVASSTSNPSASCVVSGGTAQSGGADNTATAKGKNSGVTTPSNTSTARYAITSLQLQKTVSPATFAAVGDTLNYTYTITNTSNTAVSGIFTVTDTHASVSCPVSSVTLNANGTAGDSVTCSAVYSITATDLAIGSVTNTAIGKVDTGAATIKTNFDKAVAYSNQPDMVLTKTNDIVGGQAIQGTKFFWTLTGKNQGGAAAQFNNGELVLTDTLPTGPTYDATLVTDFSSLTAGTLSCSFTTTTKVDCYASGTVTIDSGETFTVKVGVTPASTNTLTNSATIDSEITLVKPNGSLAESNEGNNNAYDVVNVSAPLPDISITKTNNTGGSLSSSGNFTWLLTVKNEGAINVVFSNTERILTDALPSGPTYGTATVQTTGVTGSAACSITGGVLNCEASSATLTMPPASEIQVSIPVTMNGTGAYKNAAIVNPDFLFVESNTGNNASLNTVQALNTPAISKAFSPASIKTGDTSTITFTLSNSNSQALTNATFTDTLTNMSVSSATLGGTCVGVTNNPALAVGATSLNLNIPNLPVSGCTIEIQVTSSTAGHHANQTSGVSSDEIPTAGSPSNTTYLDVYIPPTVSKSFTPATTLADGKSVLALTLTNPASNPGALTNVQVEDDFTATGISLSDVIFTFDPASPSDCGSVTQIGGSASQAGDTAVRFIVSASLAAGSSCEVQINVITTTVGTETNTTNAPTGTAAGSINLTGTAASADLTLPADPELTLTKTATLSTDNGTSGKADAGDVITYTFSVENTGNVTITSITVSDPLLTSLSCNTIASLAPGATSNITCTGNTYTVLQSDVDSQTTIDNTAEVSGKDPSNTTITDDDSKSVPVASTNPELTLTKTATLSTDNGTSGKADAGDVITYTFSVENTGNVTITSITVSDPLLTSLSCNTITSLAPGATSNFTCTGNTYTVLQSVIDSNGGGDGDIDNTAEVSGKDPSNTTITDDDSKSVPVVSGADLVITKTNGVTSLLSGATFSYTVVVTNNGPAGANGAIFKDASVAEINISAVTCGSVVNGAVCPALADTTVALMQGTGIVIPTLPTGSSVTFTLSAEVIGSTSVTNQATVTAPTGITDPDLVNNTATDTDPINSALGMLVVTLYEDNDHDALRQSSEAVLPEALLIEIRDMSGVLITSLTTSSGTAVFNSLPAGTYQVIKTQVVAGYLETSPVRVTVQVEASKTKNVDYGHYKIKMGAKYNLNGYVWHDVDRDAVRDAGEDPLARKVSLLDAEGNKLTEKTSDIATGYFEFTNLDAGIYAVIEEDQAPHLFSSTVNYKWAIVGPETLVSDFEDSPAYKAKARPLQQSSGGLLFGDYTRPISCNTSSGDPLLDSAGGSYPPSVAETDPYFMQFQVGNQGDADVTSVQVEVPLSSSLTINSVNVFHQVYTAPGTDAGHVTSISGNTVSITFNRISENDVYNVLISTNVRAGAPATTSTMNASITSFTRAGGDTGCGDLLGNDSGSYLLRIRGRLLDFQGAPETGFAPNRQTAIPAQPESEVYSNLGEVRLKIPNLKVDAPIVGIPYTDDWNVSWLSGSIGWLEGTSYMGGAGNSVLVGHNYLSSGSKGPLINLVWLKKNDLIYVEQGNQLLVYKVRYVVVVEPDNPLIFQHENTSTLTLVTCRDYDEKSDAYLKRVVAKAYLVEVKPLSSSEFLGPSGFLTWLGVLFNNIEG